MREVVEGMEGQIERLNLKVEQAEKRAATAEVLYPDSLIYSVVSSLMLSY